MAEDNFTLTTFYESWKAYQDQLKAALAPLTAEQLTLRAAPGLRSISENAAHIIGCRSYWFIEFMGEDGGGDERMALYARWNEATVSGSPVTPVPTAADLAQAFDRTWRLMADCLARWSPEDMQKTFPDDPVDLSRAWVVWHVLEHDLFHGGEISFALGMRGLMGIDI